MRPFCDFKSACTDWFTPYTISCDVSFNMLKCVYLDKCKSRSFILISLSIFLLHTEEQNYMSWELYHYRQHNRKYPVLLFVLLMLFVLRLLHSSGDFPTVYIYRCKISWSVVPWSLHLWTSHTCLKQYAMYYLETVPFLQNHINFLAFFSTFFILPLLDSVVHWFHSLFLFKKLNVTISLE